MGCSSSQIRSKFETISEKAFASKANKELLETITFLRGTPTFTVLNNRDYPLLAAASTKHVYKKGEVISNGAGSEEFFVVKRGEASVWMQHPCSPSGHGLVVPPSRGSGRHSLKSASGSVQGGVTWSLSANDRRESWRSDVRAESSRSSSVLAEAPATDSAHLHGRLAPSRDGPMKVAHLRSKDYFGESSLVGNEDWDLIVVVESQEMEVIKITQQSIKELGLSSRLRIPKRQRVYHSTTHVDTYGARRGSAPHDSRKPRAKDEIQRSLIRNTLTSRMAMQVFLESHDGIVEKLVDVAWKQELKENEVLIKPQAYPNPMMFVVQEGSLMALHWKERDQEPTSPGGYPPRRTSFFCAEMEERLSHITCEDDHTSTTSGSMIGPGASYGECTLMYDTPHSSQVIAKQRTIVWVIDQTDFAEAARLAHAEKLTRYIEYLEAVPLFSGLLSDEKLMIARTLVEQTWTEGQEVYRQGEVNQVFTILTDGTVEVIEDGKVEKTWAVHLDERGPVRFFGETSMTQESQPCPKTVRVVSRNARALAMSRETLQLVVGPVSNLLQQHPNSASARRRSTYSNPASVNGAPRLSSNSSQIGGLQLNFANTSSKVHKEHLRPLALLGRGGFGIVELCEDIKTKGLYALKTVKKARVAKTEFLKEQILNEKYILEMTGCRFIIKLFGTDKDSQNLYFFLEPALGGELLATYRSKKLFGSEVIARYYAASVICAFEHLHERYILYRDLKPENLMLDSQGKLKLTDMGLAKFVVGKTFTVCGTPVYFAPEVTNQSGYNYSVDWWQLGILVWELLTGRTPFPANTRGEAFYWLFTEEVLRKLHDSKYNWPSKIPEGSKEFLKALLVYDPSSRVPMLPNGPILIRQNSWFKDFSWPDLQNGSMEAPYLPPEWDPRESTENENFYAQDGMNRIEDATYKDDGTGWDADF